jgi:hypothetical protein
MALAAARRARDGVKLGTLTGGMAAMNAGQRELFEGLGLSVIALVVSGALLMAAAVGAGRADYVRVAVFGIPGAIALYWTIRFTRAQFAAYRAYRDGK